MAEIAQAPTAAVLRRELIELQREISVSSAPCTLLRTPHIHGAGPDMAVAQFYQEALLQALSEGVETVGMSIMLPQFTHPIMYRDKALFDQLGTRLCPVDELTTRYLRRKLWHVECPYPVDIGLADSKPTEAQVAEHNQRLSGRVYPG